jgi:Na+-transporting NADH:ubiquinone oxidoreductase subunit B
VQLGEGLTGDAPHVRDRINARGVARGFAVALLPCFLAGLHNVGWQAALTATALGLAPPDSWRGTVLAALGRGQDPSSVADCVVLGLLHLGPLLVASLVAGAVWQRLFATLRRRPVSSGLLPTALIVTLALPPTIPPWQVAVAVSFGIVVALEVFGGTGMNVVHPALVALAYLALAYPESMRGDAVWAPVEGLPVAPPLALAARGGVDALSAAGLGGRELVVGWLPGAPAATSSLVCLLGAAILVARRLVCWRVLAGGVVGLLATAAAFALIDADRPMASLPPAWHLAAGAFLFGLIFVATDPATSAETETGRWIFGGLVGALTVVLRILTPAQGEAVFPAILLASIAAPLIDHAVVNANVRRRRRRHA